MAIFVRENFEYHGGFLTYNDVVVARFKNTARNKPRFLTFLIKNFTVEEYFEMCKTLAPAQVLATKGHLTTIFKQFLKEHGFPPTKAGEMEFMNHKKI